MERKEVIKIKILQVLSHAGDEEGTFRSSRAWLMDFPFPLLPWLTDKGEEEEEEEKKGEQLRNGRSIHQKIHKNILTF